MIEQYFRLEIKKINDSFLFKLISDIKLISTKNIKKTVIAEDDFSNKIYIKNNKVYAYIHDIIKSDILLYENIEEFINNTKFYTYEEYENKIMSSETSEIIHDRDVYISMNIAGKYLKKSRIDERFKENGYYNITKALNLKSITQEEFEYLKTL
jgi:hypothetical protein